MPVFIGRDSVEEWYGVKPGEVAEMIASWPPIEMEAYSVSTAVNNARANGEQLVEPLSCS